MSEEDLKDIQRTELQLRDFKTDPLVRELLELPAHGLVHGGDH